MKDPRLNSVHLPAGRRELFREARGKLMNSCGEKTLAGDRFALAVDGQHTAVLGKDPRLPPGTKFVLIDRECIYPLKVGINTVGRMPDNDVVVADPYVSRRHVAILVHVPGRCEVHDIASKNGTFVNGKPIQGRAELKSGDQLQLSDHVLVFVCKTTQLADSSAEHTFAE